MAGSRNTGISAKVSQADWCLDATRQAPLGSFSRPRTSKRVPQITFSHHRLASPCSRSPSIAQRRGASSSQLPQTRKTAVLT